MNYRNTYLEVDLSKLKDNYRIYEEVSQKKVFAVIKANAYGLGLIELAQYFEEELHVPYLCVATFDEAMTLREADIKAPILVMGHTKSSYLKLAKDNNITITIPSLNYVDELIKENVEDLSVHIKVNTSMNRLGLLNAEEVVEALKLLKKQNVEGIFTHYCCNDMKTLEKDFNTFKKIVEVLNHDFKYIHASSSNSSFLLKEDFTNSSRVGVGLYGGLTEHKLKNVARLLTEVVALKDIDEGKTVSYGSIYRAEAKETIATLPIGYADGILRSDTGNMVNINNKNYPIVGNICMDQLMVKVDQSIKIYDQVEIFGNHTSITDIANKRNTINYEVLTTISSRVPRVYIK